MGDGRGRGRLGIIRAGLTKVHLELSKPYVRTNATEQGKSRDGYVCYGRVMVAGPGVDVACPVVDMDVFHQCFALRDCFRDKDMVLE